MGWARPLLDMRVCALVDDLVEVSPQGVREECGDGY